MSVLSPVGPQDIPGRIVRFTSDDGLLLTARIFDADSDRLPILCLPGLSRNSLDFVRLGTFFARHATEPRRVIALDYRGRGLSDHDPDWRNYTPLREAQDVLTAADTLEVDRALIIGTSRGGIIAMLLAGIRPDLIAGAVLNDIGPVIERSGLLRIKNYLAARRTVSSWEQAEMAAREALGSQFPALCDEDWRAYTAASYVATPSGLVPQFDEHLLQPMADPSFLEHVPALWPQFMSLAGRPVLAIRGELSDLLSTETLHAMAERHPDFEQLTVRGQGHAPLLRDEISLERILAFARRCESELVSGSGSDRDPCILLLGPKEKARRSRAFPIFYELRLRSRAGCAT